MQSTACQKKTFANHPIMKEKLRRDGSDLDHLICKHSTFDGLNALQYAAVTGDVQLLEKLVSLGAALDYPCDDYYNAPTAPGKEPKLPGSTPLLCAVENIALYSQSNVGPLIFKAEPQLREVRL
jgi:hypothetical protein